MSHVERALRAALKATDWDVKAAALRLSVSRQTVYARMQRFGITQPMTTSEKKARAGARGGARRAESLTAKELSEQNREASLARWGRKGAA